MRALVVYSSQTGNTKNVAEAVHSALPQDAEIHPVASAPDPSGYDFIAVGFWLKAMAPDPAAAEYLQRISSGKVFLFATHGAAVDAAHTRNAMEKARDMVGGATVVGSFNCPGEVEPKHLEMVSAKPEPPVWAKEAPAAKGRPNAADLEAARKAVSAAL